MWQVLAAENQLNCAANLLVDKKDEKVKLAELYFEAANLIVLQSAFFPALKYLKAGIRLLDGMVKWGHKLYALSLLELYNKLAVVADITGNFVLCQQAVDEVTVNV
jgi:predicted ATPase